MTIQRIPADIIVTTPKRQMQTAAQEAADCIYNGGGYYFRTFRRRLPAAICSGSRIFYVEAGYIRGFAVVDRIHQGYMQCETTGRTYGIGTHLLMRADSWRWIRPIRRTGFQGWAYFDASDIEIIGGWLDPKPSVQAWRQSA